jgi:CRISPR/Cas system CMR subunit Cmr6 (Cas7 group RAMP superfamily)
MTDTFRKSYKPVSPERAGLIIRLKEQAEEIEQLIDNLKSREKSLAMTNLEQAIMWATKAIILDEEKDIE